MTGMTETPHELFDTVLVANRGEIACRVIRTLRALGIRSVAVYSDADRDAAHVALADVAVRIGPAEARLSYLDVDAIIAAAERTGAQAVHPGYGFLSENAAFARACEAAGLVFIGPGIEALQTMGDKIRAKNHVAGHGVPVTHGIAEPGLDDAALTAAADRIGYPILVKPSAGGGGKGMYAVTKPADLPEALRAARRVASAAFGDDTLFLERLIPTPRHIEVQVLADRYGAVIHLGERECSLQRRHQKVIEEAPSALLDERTRERIGEAACAVARSVDYVGAGTVEFIVAADAPHEFFFMEMNTRLQVEHPVTEAVTGIDLVEQQIRIAAGEPLALRQQDVRLSGHAVEARVYAEDPQHGFAPSIGRVLVLREPGGAGIRVDSALRQGLSITPDYDPMLGKVIAHGADRAQAIGRLRRALNDTVVLGVHTNVEYLAALLAEPAVRAGELDTGLIERTMPGIAFHAADDDQLTAAALSIHAAAWSAGSDAPWTRPTGWRLGAARPVTYGFTLPDGTVANVDVMGPPSAASVRVRRGGCEPADLRQARLGEVASDADAVRLEIGDHVSTLHLARTDRGLWIADGAFSTMLAIRDRDALQAERRAARAAEEGPASPNVTSPMPGTVVAVAVANGDWVEADATLVTVEAMKMEHRLAAPVAGNVSIGIRQGDLVKAGQVVATVTPPHEG